METEQRIKEIRKGTLKWYPFRKGARVLFVGEADDPLFEMLINDIEGIESTQVERVVADAIDTLKQSVDADNIYDYIIAIESLEGLHDVEAAIEGLSKHLQDDGHMILGFNNRFGIRYFLGDRDPHTNRILDGIENYRRAYSKKEDKYLGKCYDKATMVGILDHIGLHHKNLSLFPDFSNTQLILRDDYESNEDLLVRIFPTYNYAKTVFMEEDQLYDALKSNNMLHAMANCFLFDCTFTGEELDVLQVTSSMGRDEEDAFFTIIEDRGEDNRVVIKQPGYSEGKEKIDKMLEIADSLKSQGINVVDMEIDDKGNLFMPYISSPTAHLFFRELAFEDEELFLKKLDEFVDLIKQSSEHVSEDKNDGEGVIAKKAYIDMIPLNCFYIDGEYTFYDQEFYKENYPLNVIIYRIVVTVSQSISEAKLSISCDDLLKRYNVYDKREKWAKMEWKFLTDLRKDNELSQYYNKKRYNSNQIYANRLRMNFSADEYLRRFINIFKGINNKKVIIFGTGVFSKQFMQMYGQDLDIVAVVDNNMSRHGEEFYGVNISAPEIINTFNKGTYRVIICIKNFLSVVNQLEEMGVSDYGIFVPDQMYQKPKKKIDRISERQLGGGNEKPKKYHIGYIAGVFDLFHIGHLEKFKLAKEQCDYLIVGLVSDEGVIKHKKTNPFVPFEERKAMLEACRYVDEVVKIPLDLFGSKDAWRMYGFDVQFSGSDYVDDAWWHNEREFLEEQGVDMVFFPYTESTSSSKLKELIDKKLI